MFGSFDLWFKSFKTLVTATIPDPDELDEDDNVFLQADWEEKFSKLIGRKSLKVVSEYMKSNTHFLVF